MLFIPESVGESPNILLLKSYPVKCQRFFGSAME